MKERAVRVLGVPREVLFDEAVVRVAGAGEVEIENHRGILAYTAEEARVRVVSGAVRVRGKGLVLRALTKERVIVGGAIQAVLFEEAY